MFTGLNMERVAAESYMIWEAMHAQRERSSIYEQHRVVCAKLHFLMDGIFRLYIVQLENRRADYAGILMYENVSGRHRYLHIFPCLGSGY